MAIFYCQMSVVSRSTGRSAVASAAYRAAVVLINERDGLVHDYSRREGVGHSEIVLPESVDARWALDRSALWNAAERAEPRKDARVAREFVVALPHELSEGGRQDLTRSFAQDLAERYGAAVDFAIHTPGTQGDVRNHHAHVLMTTRQVTSEGLGPKTYIELANKELLPKGLPSTQMQLVDIRRSWEGMANEHLAREGHDIRIDHRSYAERGLEIEPTEHMGVGATNVYRRGGHVDRSRLAEEARERNADLIREKPEQVLAIITSEKSVFDRHDIARTLHRYINNDAQAFQNAFASVMASPTLTELRPERVDGQAGEVELARYSTQEMVDVERGMSDAAERMHQARTHHVDTRHAAASMEKMDEAMRITSGDADRRLSNEQRRAVVHVTGPEQIAAVVGLAGAGKSTMLAAAADAWKRQGYAVQGAALSGKAAEGLEESSGIKSRTLASWSRSWENEKHQLGRGDVFVIDEAGMVGSRQLASFVGEAEKRGAKIVLVGDHEQLQAIGAGAPFRAIAEQVGHVSLGEIKRQFEPWQQEASVAFASHRTIDALAAYRENGNIHFAEGREAARAAVVENYLADQRQHPDGSRVAMAHRRVDVRAINDGIRSELQNRGELAKGEEAGELSYQTNDGERRFAPGDRLVFLENSRDLGVKNGMLGQVKTVEKDAIHVELDGTAGQTDPRMVRVPMNDYRAVDHGYATTIHKNQGATVDRAFVLASGTMDRHLTYVAMSRHRHDVQLYADSQEFRSSKGAAVGAQGRLVEHGAAPYEHKAGNRESYFVTLENAKGERHTTWGVDLQRAVEEAGADVGSAIGLQHKGSEPMRLPPDGHETNRHSWAVVNKQDLAYAQLETRLSRSGAKETTLDYAREFAERRGIAERLGVHSEIEISTGARERGILVPAKTQYDQSVGEVAAERTIAKMDAVWSATDRLLPQVFKDPKAVSEKLLSSLARTGGDTSQIEKGLTSKPEQYGELLGKTGLLGDNRDRIDARQNAAVVSRHVSAAGAYFQRSQQQEMRDEQRQRERDKVIVPDLSPEAEAALSRIDLAPANERSAKFDELRVSASGRSILGEVGRVSTAMQQRFGSSLPAEIKARADQDPQLSHLAERVTDVAKLIGRAANEQTQHQHALEKHGQMLSHRDHER
ncbi:Ti-type conjugative transfer relaxase TraA [Rhizobium panacihumi]|uniref:Ti-type conjugative transfer relaxase TraA n=1 Tax=Rhizobium panacihumi TaxID=2008450 RepID=UPI003D79AFE9